jgi:hypothetical protein
MPFLISAYRLGGGGEGVGGEVDDRNIQNAFESCGGFDEIFVTDS